jgi:hypothetical protein
VSLTSFALARNLKKRPPGMHRKIPVQYAAFSSYEKRGILTMEIYFLIYQEFT